MPTRTRVAVLILGAIVMFGCAWSDKQLKEATDQVGFWGSLFGTQGIVPSAAITSMMIGGVKLYRWWKGDPALTAMAAGTAAAIQMSHESASPAEIRAVLTQSIPGTQTEVKADKVAEIVADAKVA